MMEAQSKIIEIVGKTMQNFDIPSFRIKRSHKKSRLGCIRCKSRRVKCDETKPDCRQCRRRGLSCTYERPVSNGASPASPNSPDDAGATPQELGVSDTELMRHFFAHTSDTFAASSIRGEHVDLWKIVIPALAYTHSPVRLGLLTASALCTSYDLTREPQEAKKYFDVAKYHGERFVAEARAQTRRFDSSDFDSILACSRLLACLGFAFYRTHRANGAKLSDSAAWTWLHLVRGVKIVFDAVQQSNAKLDPLMSINMIPEITSLPGISTNGMQWHRANEQFYLVQDTQIERSEALFAALRSKQTSLTNEEVEALDGAIVSLNKVTTHICTGEVHSVYRAICTWPGSISNAFMNLLLENEPFALVVYAHWLMLVVLVRETWWFGDMGVAGIREVVDICSRDDPSLESLLHLPMQMASGARGQ